MRTTGNQIFKVRLILLSILLLLALGAQAQVTGDKPDNPPVATEYGNTGLWKVFNADNMARGQAGFNGWYDRINRNPGFLTISTAGVSGAVGLTNWLELGANFEINRRVLVRRADQLSFGQEALGLFGTQVPGAAPNILELMPGSDVMPQLRYPATRTGAYTGSAGYYNDLPFAGSRGSSNGIGTVSLGLKMNALSESRGDHFGLAFHVYATLPTHRAVGWLLNHPTQTGEWQYGTDVILSKYLGSLAELDLNAGFRGVSSPGDGRHVTLSDEVPLGFGFVIPRKMRIQAMGEVTAEVYVGNFTPQTSFDARDPMDATLGFRAFLPMSFSLSAGYRRPLNQFGGDKNGFVVDLSYTSPVRKPVPPTPPSLSCTADPTDILAGQPVALSAQAVSSAGAALTYSWSTTGGTIDGTGPTVRLRTDNLAPGVYTQTVRASDLPDNFADCTTRVTVRNPPPPPAQPPTVMCSADKTTVQVGEIVNITGQGRSPQNRPLTYQWTVTGGGRVEGTGATVRFDTTGLRPGSYTVHVTVTDDRTLSAECQVQIVVQAPPPPPPPPPPAQVQKLNECSFLANSPRVDNVCKAKLDDAALRLKNEPDSTLTIVGFAASNERRAAMLATSRANNTKAYLVKEKDISDSRIQVRQGTVAAGAAQRKVDIHLVPRGATFTGRNALPVHPDQENRVGQLSTPVLRAPIAEAARVSATRGTPSNASSRLTAQGEDTRKVVIATAR